jgi:hypothetical protein
MDYCRFTMTGTMLVIFSWVPVCFSENRFSQTIYRLASAFEKNAGCSLKTKERLFLSSVCSPPFSAQVLVTDS